jgi:hypothetical protein
MLFFVFTRRLSVTMEAMCDVVCKGGVFFCELAVLELGTLCYL